MAVGFPDLVNAYISGGSVRETATASVDGASLDLQEGEGPVAAIVSIGAASGTTPTLDVKLQESTDDSTFTDISGATLAQKTDSDANSLFVIDTHRRAAQFVRAVATITGSSPSFHLHIELLSASKSF